MTELTSSGIPGLDKVLFGGFPKGSPIILEGAPGTGKTTLGLQFLYNGIIEQGEPGLYITFEELPEQLYRDMKAFGWDLRALERQNQLRILCLSPEVLLEEMMEPGGLFERVVEEIGCKRIVIDSLNMFQYSTETEGKHRQTIYLLRNTLRKFSLTSLFIREQTYLDPTIIPFGHYVVDGVIRLSLQKQYENYRKRTLEVLKMRGCKIMEGEHIYRLTDNGIHLIPARSMVEDFSINDQLTRISTGLPRLDQVLGGGVKGGSVFLLDTNSRANYRHLIASLMSNRILAGENALFLLSSLASIESFDHMLKRFDVRLEDWVKDNKAYFIEYFNRPVPSGFESNVINVSDLDNKQYYDKLRSELGPVIGESMKRGEKWCMFYDLNTVFSERGKDFVMKFFSEEAAKARSAGLTIFALCNFAELDYEAAAFLERTSNGVIRTWVDGNYQYIQITKSPEGRMSEPLLVENIENRPFIRLV
ncbi:MAG TPA: ATPase domain-containing protein [Bacillales bacterium]